MLGPNYIASVFHEQNSLWTQGTGVCSSKRGPAELPRSSNNLSDLDRAPERTTPHTKKPTFFPGQLIASGMDRWPKANNQHGLPPAYLSSLIPTILSFDISAVGGISFHQSTYQHYQIIIHLCWWLFTDVCFLSQTTSSMRVGMGQVLLTTAFYQLAELLTHATRHLINAVF